MAPPNFVSRFLRSMPRTGKAMRAAVIATAGGEGGPAALRAASLLRRRGYDVELSARVNYAENWTQVGAVLGNEAEVISKTEKGDARVRDLSGKLAAGEREEDSVPFPTRLLGYLMGFAFGVFGRRFLGKLFIANELCNGCGSCARSCPSRTILMGKGRKARPFWRMNCENCNRCINICPKAAINTSIASIVLQFASIGFLIVLSLRAVNELFWPAIGESLGPSVGPTIHAALLVIAVLGSHFLSIGPVDYFIYRRLRGLPGLRKIFGLSFSQGFRRYLAPGFKLAAQKAGKE
jgi:ferredoxin